jgi:hypothetical protein
MHGMVPISRRCERLLRRHGPIAPHFFSRFGAKTGRCQNGRPPGVEDLFAASTMVRILALALLTPCPM